MKKSQPKSRAAKKPVNAVDTPLDAGGHDHGDGALCDHDHGACCDFDLAIRVYRPEDYRALKAIWKAAEIIVDETDSAKALKENIETRKNGFQVFVAEVIALDPKSGQPSGAHQLAGGVIVTFDGHRAYIYHFAVSEDFRGVGLGAALLETCEHQAKLWGAKHLRLMSRMDAAREGARRLYEKTGWQADPKLCQFKKEF